MHGHSPQTLCVDIGGTFIKATVLDAAGALLSERVRLPTPKPAVPQSVMETIATLMGDLPGFDRVSVGFPGVVKRRAVVTAPNLGTPYWSGYAIADALAARLNAPARVLNDAILQGFGTIIGKGVECVITFGTGMGCAVFRGGQFALQMELGRHIAQNGLVYDDFIGQAAFAAQGPEIWNERVRHCVNSVIALVQCDMLYLGGGNARHVHIDLPANVGRAPEAAAFTGGWRIWRDGMEWVFPEEFDVTAGRAVTGPDGCLPPEKLVRG